MKKFLTSLLVASMICASTFAQFANTSLSNLKKPTKINQSLIPSEDNIQSLGASALNWRNLYLQGPLYIDGVKFIDNPVSGAHNTAAGWDALHSVISDGVDNTAVGYEALYSNTDGSDNTASGYQALYFNNGSDNTATGYLALYNNTIGTSNTATGAQALYYNSTGQFNTANGTNALYLATTANENTAFGGDAGYNVKTGSLNTFFGYLANCGSLGTLTNSTAIGANATVTTNNTVRFGDANITSIGGYAKWTKVSDARVKENIKEDVPGLAFIELLRPVTFNYDLQAADKIMFPDKNQDQPAASASKQQIEDEARQAKEKIVYSGFIAQEVEAAAEKIGYDFSGVDKPSNESSLYGLRYADFVAPLVKAVQELAQQKGNLQMKNDALRIQHEDLEKRFAVLQSKLSDVSNK